MIDNKTPYEMTYPEGHKRKYSKYYVFLDRTRIYFKEKFLRFKTNKLEEKVKKGYGGQK